MIFVWSEIVCLQVVWILGRQRRWSSGEVQFLEGSDGPRDKGRVLADSINPQGNGWVTAGIIVPRSGEGSILGQRVESQRAVLVLRRKQEVFDSKLQNFRQHRVQAAGHPSHRTNLIEMKAQGMTRTWRMIVWLRDECCSVLGRLGKLAGFICTHKGGWTDQSSTKQS